MCMRKVNIKNDLTNLQHFKLRQLFDQCTYWIMDNSVDFVKSTSPRAFIVSFYNCACMLQAF